LKRIEISRDIQWRNIEAWRGFHSLSRLPKIKVVEVRLLDTVLFTDGTCDSLTVVRVRGDRTRKGYPVSIHRISAADADRSRSLGWLFSPGGGEFLPPSKVATPRMQHLTYSGRNISPAYFRDRVVTRFASGLLPRVKGTGVRPEVSLVRV